MHELRVFMVSLIEFIHFVTPFLVKDSDPPFTDFLLERTTFSRSSGLSYKAEVVRFFIGEIIAKKLFPCDTDGFGGFCSCYFKILLFFLGSSKSIFLGVIVTLAFLWASLLEWYWFAVYLVLSSLSWGYSSSRSRSIFFLV